VIEQQIISGESSGPVVPPDPAFDLEPELPTLPPVHAPIAAEPAPPEPIADPPPEPEPVHVGPATEPVLIGEATAPIEKKRGWWRK
jgi:hypothetical protein